MSERLTPAQRRLLQSLIDEEEAATDLGESARQWVELLDGELRVAKALQAKGLVEISDGEHDVRLTSAVHGLPLSQGGAVPTHDTAERIAEDLAVCKTLDELASGESIRHTLDALIVRARYLRKGGHP